MRDCLWLPGDTMKLLRYIKFLVYFLNDWILWNLGKRGALKKIFKWYFFLLGFLKILPNVCFLNFKIILKKNGKTTIPILQMTSLKENKLVFYCCKQIVTLNTLRSTNVLSYQSLGQKSDVSLTELKSVCQQGSAPFPRLRGESFLLLLPAFRGCLPSLAHVPCSVFKSCSNCPAPQMHPVSSSSFSYL